MYVYFGRVMTQSELVIIGLTLLWRCVVGYHHQDTNICLLFRTGMITSTKQPCADQIANCLLEELLRRTQEEVTSPSTWEEAPSGWTEHFHEFTVVSFRYSVKIPEVIPYSTVSPPRLCTFIILHSDVLQSQ